MRDFVIISDSTCDLDNNLRKNSNIDYVMMNFIYDDKEYPASLDWEAFSPHEFYELMRSGGRITTTQVPADVFTDKFTYYLDRGFDIIYISCSSALSGSINLSRKIADELRQKYTDAKIYCIDSLISSLGQGYLAITAAQLRAQGKSVDETAEYIEANKLKVNQCGTVGTLNYLKQAGRVTASSAFFGNLLGVKPIIISDKIGQNFAVKKVKGALNAKIEIASFIESTVENAAEQTLYLSHADTLDDAIALRDIILQKVKFKDVCINYIGPIVGASVGPGTIISFCLGKEVTIVGEA